MAYKTFEELQVYQLAREFANQRLLCPNQPFLCYIVCDMVNLEQIRRILCEQKPLLERKFGVKELGIFGSYLRGEQRNNSDVDILVGFSRTVSLLEFIRMENYLSEVLGVKVDLVMKDALKPRIGKHIMAETQSV
jgi:predicted nucleotidyltransferase